MNAVEKLAKKDAISGYVDNYTSLSPVGTFPKDPQLDARGLRDLSGNVWEWVADDFGGEQAKMQRLGVLRGGSFRSKDRSELLSSHRKAVPVSSKTDDIGFRIVLSPAGKVAREGD